MDIRIPFHVLEQTTEEFSDKQMIGSGGFGKVYKGVYNGEHIAVKLFYDVPSLDHKTFENEFSNILRIQHPNIVRLVGYCYETQHKYVEYNGQLWFCQHIYRILCFELMQGGSLDKYLNGKIHKVQVISFVFTKDQFLNFKLESLFCSACAEESRDYDWPTCYDIIKGTCEGLNFLHAGCGSQILHLDLKPGNILLDKNMRAKVADFGLSRLFSKTHTHITNTTAGTEEYMPPEFRSNRQISPKNDVYSLGIIIIEILVGRRGYLEFREMDDVTSFAELVTKKWREWIYATTSPCPSAEIDQVETCIKIAVKCVDHERMNRPTVAEILDTLRKTEKGFHLLGQSLPTHTKIGPRGGMGGSLCDIKENPWRLTSLTVFCRGIIDSISFSYIDQSGRKQHAGPWGVDYISQNTETICFGSSEFVEEGSGSYGSYRGILRVISLTIVTNVRTYGPFGNPYHKHMTGLTHFRFMADEGTRIVGFHGRSGSYVDAIGIYMYPNNRTAVGAISVPLILDGQSLPTLTKSRSWGGSGGHARDINEKPWRLTSLTVSYKGLIDAFSFSYIDQAGKKQSVGPWGEGYYNDTTKTIRFGPSECVKEVSGAYGIHNEIVIVKFLTFVTNEGTYGPFGTPDHPGPDVSATHFRFVADEGSSIVGFYGRSGRYIDVIGVYTVRVR